MEGGTTTWEGKGETGGNSMEGGKQHRKGNNGDNSIGRGKQHIGRGGQQHGRCLEEDRMERGKTASMEVGGKTSWRGLGGRQIGRDGRGEEGGRQNGRGEGRMEGGKTTWKGEDSNGKTVWNGKDRVEGKRQGGRVPVNYLTTLVSIIMLHHLSRTPSLLQPTIYWHR